MKLKWIVGLLFSTALAVPSPAQISVYIGHPTRPRYEHDQQGWQLREGHWDHDHRGPDHDR